MRFKRCEHSNPHSIALVFFVRMYTRIMFLFVFTRIMFLFVFTESLSAIKSAKFERRHGNMRFAYTNKKP